MNLFPEHFQDKDKAREYLEEVRWPHGPVCPHCGTTKTPIKLEGISHQAGLYKCSENECRKQFTVTVKTIFERSKVPLNKWLAAVHLMCASKKGISANQIHRMLGVTYKTAWFMCHRIPEAMNDGRKKLGSNGGIVEVDESYWGNSKPKGNTARGYANKMKVLSLVDHEGQKRSFHFKAVDSATLEPILESQICNPNNLMTDDTSQYVKIGRGFVSHGIVNHSSNRVYTRSLLSHKLSRKHHSLLRTGWLRFGWTDIDQLKQRSTLKKVELKQAQNLLQAAGRSADELQVCQ